MIAIILPAYDEQASIASSLQAAIIAARQALIALATMNLRGLRGLRKTDAASGLESPGAQRGESMA